MIRFLNFIFKKVEIKAAEITINKTTEFKLNIIINNKFKLKTLELSPIIFNEISIKKQFKANELGSEAKEVRPLLLLVRKNENRLENNSGKIN